MLSCSDFDSGFCFLLQAFIQIPQGLLQIRHAHSASLERTHLLTDHHHAFHALLPLTAASWVQALFHTAWPVQMEPQH